MRSAKPWAVDATFPRKVKATDTGGTRWTGKSWARQRSELFDTPPPPDCACGCGEAVAGLHNGVWSQWRPGHSKRRRVNR
jgi:hypothetical protein